MVSSAIFVHQAIQPECSSAQRFLYETASFRESHRLDFPFGCNVEWLQTWEWHSVCAIAKLPPLPLPQQCFQKFFFHYFGVFRRFYSDPTLLCVCVCVCVCGCVRLCVCGCVCVCVCVQSSVQNWIVKRCACVVAQEVRMHDGLVTQEVERSVERSVERQRGGETERSPRITLSLAAWKLPKRGEAVGNKQASYRHLQ